MKTVAVLDDDDSLVELYHTFLEEEGYKVKRAIFSRHLPEVLENIRHTQSDMLILDVHLPGLGSFEIMQGMYADEQLKQLPILVCSASGPSLKALHRLMTEANLTMPKTMEKPFELDDLAASVAELTSAN